jgi:hypothetical protein
VLNCVIFGVLFRPLQPKRNPQILKSKLDAGTQQLRVAVEKLSVLAGSEVDLRPISELSSLLQQQQQQQSGTGTGTDSPVKKMSRTGK